MAVLPVAAPVPATGHIAETNAAEGASPPPVSGPPPVSDVPKGPVLVTPALAPSGRIGPRPGGVRLGKPSRRTAVVLGVVLAVLVGGGVVVFTVFKPPTAESTVERYFDELADGDTAGALKLVADGSRYSAAEFPFLVPKALSDKSARPADLRIVRTDSTAIEGQASEAVQVSYKILGATVEQTIAVTKTPDGDPEYQLHEPFLQLSVASLAGRRLAVNGVTAAVNEEDATFVFPGAYTATAQGDALVAGATQAAAVQPDESGDQPVAAIDFGTPTLAPGAQEAVQAKVKQQIDACAQSTSSEPPDCPFSLFVFGSDVSVKWSITAYPTLTVALSSAPSADQQVDISSDVDGGVAHYVATYTDQFSGESKTESGDQRFGVRGTATASGGQLTLSIS